MAVYEPTVMMTFSNTYEPTVKDLDHLHIESINTVLHGEGRRDCGYCGPSKMQLWKKIATELIPDIDVINTMERMDITPCEDWLQDICFRSGDISICRLIEISTNLERNDVKEMLEEIYDLGIRYMHEMIKYQQERLERLAKLLEDDDKRSTSWKDFANQLYFTTNQIEQYYTWKHPLMVTVMMYLQKWKPSTTLSRLQKICRDELHHIGANVIGKYKAEISAIRNGKGSKGLRKSRDLYEL